MLATAAAMRAMGATIERGDDGVWRVHGVGVGGLLQPATRARHGQFGHVDAAARWGWSRAIRSPRPSSATPRCRKRPMGRVIEPLSLMGADITASPGGRLPLMVRGLCPAVPIEYTLPVASAQVKSAVLLAGLNTPGITRVIEPVPTRDHSERMLRRVRRDADGRADAIAGRVISITGEAELKPQHIVVPGDPCSAAFWMVAASIVPGSEVTIANVGLNPTRAGLFTALRMMGADITEVDPRTVGGEPVADLIVRHAPLTRDRGAARSRAEHDRRISRSCSSPPRSPRGARWRAARTNCASRNRTASPRWRPRSARAAWRSRNSRTAWRSTAPAASRSPAARRSRRCSITASRWRWRSRGCIAKAPITIDDAAPVATSYPTFFATLDAIARRMTIDRRALPRQRRGAGGERSPSPRALFAREPDGYPPPDRRTDGPGRGRPRLCPRQRRPRRGRSRRSSCSTAAPAARTRIS